MENNNQPRTFADVLNQWTDSLLKENAKTETPNEALIIMRVGLLGQRLITEANVLGMQEMADMAKARQ